MKATIFVGYDPGGDGTHGVAQLSCANGKRIGSVQTLPTAEKVIKFLEKIPSFDGIGVDTLTCWSTGSGGWRPADRWLRKHYREARNSVMTPNGLAGSMGINGMAVLLATRQMFPSVPVIETHPKVLYWALAQKKYKYDSSKAEMDDFLCKMTGAEVSFSNEHEWDALFSAFAAANGVLKLWTNDLHALATDRDERLIMPCCKTNYYWPH